MIRFTVIGGYLGTGKTTLLNHVLRNNESRRIALIVNDFGEINIDAGLIESQTESQINLTNGCVCCTLSDGFHESIDQLCQLVGEGSAGDEALVGRLKASRGDELHRPRNLADIAHSGASLD